MQKGAGIIITALYLLYLGIVAFLCFFNFSTPSFDLGKSFLGIRLDRYAHFAMFFPYPFIAWLTFNYSKYVVKYKRMGLPFALVSGLIFAAGTEIAQDLIFKSRQGDTFDFLADSLAIIVASIIVSLTGHWMVEVVERIFSKPNSTTCK